MAIYRGLQMAWNNHTPKLKCYSDSTNAIHLINEEDIYFHKYAAIFMDIREFLNRPWEVQILHILREGNMCADHLAKKGALQNYHLMLLEDSPKTCYDFYLLMPLDLKL
ncbi:Ribonuclease H domain [Sesbania bispinosa]|nr:Ribonuclease H domain [Sesbania bispinosa]